MKELNLLVALIKTLPDPVLLLDGHGQILAANTPGEVLLGYPELALKGVKLDELVISKNGPQPDVNGRTAWLNGQTNDLQLAKKDGSLFSVSMAIVRLPLAPREYYSCVLHDNSKLESLVAARTKGLEAIVSELQETSRQKSRLVSVASHEFRTPLSNIQLSSSLVAHYFDRLDKNKILHHLQKIDQAVAEMTGTLNDLLSLEKIESGKTEVQRVNLNLADYCKVIAEGFKDQLQPGQQLQCHFRGRFKKVYTDEHLLRHCLSNLLSNAIKYSPEGGTIRLESGAGPGQYWVTVDDQGIGIPEADLEQLLQPFFRAGNVGGIPGTGLGLSIVRKCAALLSGSVKLDNKPGKGCQFTLILPVSKTDATT